MIEKRLKRHWARLLWVTITNIPILAISISILIEARREEIRSYIGRPPLPRLWTVFYDNPIYTLALVLSAAGTLVEAINRREAGFFNCCYWLALAAYTVALGWPALATAVVVGIFAVDLAWYFLLPVRNAAQSR